MGSRPEIGELGLQVKLLQSDGDEPADHFGHHIIPQALKSSHKVVAHNFDGYWRVIAHSPVLPDHSHPVAQHKRLHLLLLGHLHWCRCGATV